MEDDHEHPLAHLAEEIQSLAKKDANLFAPILSKWHPQAIAITACLLHSLYQKELVWVFLSYFFYLISVQSLLFGEL